MAANPSRAEIQSQWSAAIKILDAIRLFGNVNASNFVGLQDTLEQLYEGDFIDEAENAIQAIRAALAGSVSSTVAQAVQRPFLRQYLRSIVQKTNLTNDQEMLDELYKYLADNAIYVQSRVFTYGTPTLSSQAIGTTQMIRLTRDDRNFPVENGFGDSKRALCVLDENTGVFRGQEVWQIKSNAPYRDALQISGSGAEALISGKTIDDSLINNAGFRSFGGTASVPTSLTSWTSSAGDSSSIYTIDQTNYFRAAPSDGGTSSSLSLVASTTLSQKLTVRGTEMDVNVPYATFVIWNRTIGSGNGTLKCRMGSISTDITVAAQSGWQVTSVPNPMGFSAWYRQNAQADFQIALEWSRTSGTLNIGEVLFVPGSFYDGSWYWIVPSSATYVAPRVNDQITWGDTVANTGVNQLWVARAWGRYFPSSAGSSILWADA